MTTTCYFTFGEQLGGQHAQRDHVDMRRFDKKRAMALVGALYAVAQVQEIHVARKHVSVVVRLDSGDREVIERWRAVMHKAVAEAMNGLARPKVRA